MARWFCRVIAGALAAGRLGCRSGLGGWTVLFLALLAGMPGVRADTGPEFDQAALLGMKGVVEISRSGASVWDPAHTNLVLHLGDQLRTGENSRATLRLRDATIVNVGELSTLRVQGETGRSILELIRGVMSFFHRDQPGDVGVRGPGVSAIVRGTEFVVSLTEQERFELVLFEGLVEVENPSGRVSAGSGETVTAAPGTAPVKSPSLAGNNRSAIQWVLYYPAVLDPSDLAFDPAEGARWKPIVELYRAGDLWGALKKARELGEPTTDSGRVFRAALHLAVGDVAGMERWVAVLPSGSREARLGEALREVVRAVRFEAAEPDVAKVPAGERLATELLASSYACQSRGRLGDALAAARRATVLSPAFGFAWVRVAELEFGSGHPGEARLVLARALGFSPRHAAAVSLEGFLLAAQGKDIAARRRFDEAIGLDAALGDAWLGRGLVRIHRGDVAGGRVDLETAGAAEPQRSVLRSYLGKAFAEEGNDARALEELARARELDPEDPTAWLYAALLHYRRHELGKAIRDLEASVERNGNRAVYRSRMLLDQDAAVRGANLANLYQVADMADVARRESARAVMQDYGNYSAHLNLASSYNALRDPTRFNLRDETVWLNEHLLASLLAPTGATPLSQNLSQNEYSRLFARNRVGLNTTTEYFGNGELRQLATHTGNFDRLSYALDVDYDRTPGVRPNQDLSRIEWYTRAKAQVTQADSVLLLTKYEDYDSGDNFQYSDASRARPSFRFRESQSPLVLGGFHHEWNPGSHTLFLGGRLENEQHFSDRAANQLVAFESFPVDPQVVPLDVQYRNQFEIYTVEASHILQGERHTTILGGRFQTGRFEATADLDPAALGGLSQVFGGTNVVTSGDGDFERRSAYLYHTWEMVADLRLTAGMSYDGITSPSNFRRPPLESGTVERQRWSPKGALVYSPTPVVTLRAMYARSLGGASYDESIRLEPTQLAGFPQAFRTLISESLVGSVEVPRHDSAGMALDMKWSTRTYASAEATLLRGAVDRRIGDFRFDSFRAPPDPLAMPGGTDESLRYEEHGARLTVNQILADEWFAQGSYRFTRSELGRTLGDIPASPSFGRLQSERSDLHRVGASLLYQRADGWFGRATATWLHQENNGPNAPATAGFTDFDLYAGWRFPRHLGDVTVGVLNVGGGNHRLHPLTPYEEFPRERMFYCRLRLNL